MINGVLLVDKPMGCTSHDVVRKVRRAFGTRKVGHTGTLDPMATGVLPIALGEATRLVQYIMEGQKLYRATLRLGQVTDTQDAEGQILEESEVEDALADRVAMELQGFMGEIEQLPPMYSALKKDGVPLYKLARAGKEVERSLRPITIYKISLIRVELPFVEFEVACSKGTYVRTLCHDLGERLGCGAHMTALRRLRTEPYHIDQCQSLAAVEAGEARLLGLEEAVSAFPRGELSQSAGVRLANGIPPTLDDLSESPQFAPGELVALFLEGKLAALARFEPDRLQETRGDFVLLNVFNQAWEA